MKIGQKIKINKRDAVVLAVKGKKFRYSYDDSNDISDWEQQ